MQVFGPSTSPLVTGIGVGTGVSAYTDLINQYAKTLASGSTASLDDQLAAWTNVGSLAMTDDNQGGGLLYDLNKTDAKRAIDMYSNSDLAKSMQKVDRQFNDFGLTSVRSFSGGDFNVAQNKLDNLARFSQDDQKKIFFAEYLNVPGAYVVGTKEIYYADLDSWKADLKQQAAAFSQQQNATATASSAVDPAAVAGAVSATSTASTPASKPKTASQTASASAPVATTAADANIALQLLLTSQAETRSSAAAAHAPTASAHGASAYAASQASSATPNVSRTASASL